MELIKKQVETGKGSFGMSNKESLEELERFVLSLCKDHAYFKLQKYSILERVTLGLDILLVLLTLLFIVLDIFPFHIVTGIAGVLFFVVAFFMFFIYKKKRCWHERYNMVCVDLEIPGRLSALAASKKDREAQQ